MSIKMHAKSLAAVPILALVLALLPVLPALAAGEGIKQQLAMPAYFQIPPDGGSNFDDLWDDVEAASGSNFGFVVANVLNGPDTAVRSNLSSSLTTVRGNGTKVIGYVDTGYFGRLGAKTRDNQTSVAAWRAQVQADVNAWYSLYSGKIDGIFFDNMDTECGTGNNTVRNYWHANDYVEQTYPGAITVGNPGAAVPSCYESAADTLVTFEGTYDCYQQDAGCPTEDQYSAVTWTNSDPFKFMHLVYDTPSGDLSDALADSKARRAGYVYATEEAGDNPYATVPGYLSTELSNMPANGTSDTTAPSVPTIQSWNPSYTSTELTWTKSTDAGSGVAAYDVYDNTSGILLASFKATAASLRTVTITGLANDTTYSFVVKARDGSGNVSAASTPQSVTTTSDPTATPWSAPGQPTANNTSYTSLDLTWTHATGGTHDKAFYEILKDGVPIQKITSATNTTHINDLQPNTTYSFTVRAGDQAGYTWSQSTARTVTTTALPGSDSITNESGDISGSTVTFGADLNLPWAIRRAYIDVDSNAATGYQAYFGASTGADYILENGKLYQANSNGSTWDVTEVTGSGVTYNTPSTTFSDHAYSWVVPLSALGNPSVSSMDYELEGSFYGTYKVDGPFTAL